MTKKFFYLIIGIIIFASACNSNLESEIIMYYPDSIPKLEYFYKYEGNNKYVAKEIRYYPNGVIQTEGQYNSLNQKEGKWSSYFENGKKWLVENYTEDIKNGKIIEWYRSGDKMYEGYYKNGIIDGNWTLWDEKGKKVSTTKYVEGEVVK